MKKKNLIVLIAVVSMTAAAYAEDYSCHAKANPDRGFDIAFDLQINGAKVGSEIVIQSSGKKNKLGTVTEITSLKANDPKHKPAFEAVLGFIADPDVSGVSENTLRQVSSIQIFRDGDSETEVSVFRLFVKDKQVGGSLVIDGHGTSCL